MKYKVMYLKLVNLTKIDGQAQKIKTKIRRTVPGIQKFGNLGRSNRKTIRKIYIVSRIKLTT